MYSNRLGEIGLILCNPCLVQSWPQKTTLMQNQHTELSGLLASFLNRERVQDLVSEHAVVKRQRHFDPYLLLCILVLGFKQSNNKTLSSLCRLYAQEAPKALSDSSFRERFTPELEACFQALFLELSQKILAMQNLQQALLSKFQEILVSDSTILTLNNSLARLFPGVATPAAAKLHMVMSVTISARLQPSKFVRVHVQTSAYGSLTSP